MSITRIELLVLNDSSYCQLLLNRNAHTKHLVLPVTCILSFVRVGVSGCGLGTCWIVWYVSGILTAFDCDCGSVSGCGRHTYVERERERERERDIYICFLWGWLLCTDFIRGDEDRKIC